MKSSCIAVVASLALFRILMACTKAGTASFLGYPVTLLFIPKVLARVNNRGTSLYNRFIFKAAIRLSSNTETCVYMASCSILFVGTVNNKPPALNSHMHNVENQYIIQTIATV